MLVDGTPSPDVERRVVFMTDMMPNTGTTGDNEFLLDRRVLPGESIADVDAEVDDLLAAAAREDDVDAERETVQYYESASIPPDHALADLVRAATGDRAPGDPWGMEAATDAREFVAADIPAVVWGPGSLSQAHTVDEHVSLAEARDAQVVLASVVERVLAGDLDDAPGA
jgi:succinyl-diaminopimelate desuccinylase